MSQDPSICIYIVFHRQIFEHLYDEMTTEDKKCLTIYGVRDRINTSLNIVYEQDLKHYNGQLQRNVYNEGSAFYHIYLNPELYQTYDYIGFGQYDMKLFSNTLPNIKHIIKNSQETPIIVFDFFPDINQTGFLGAHNLIKSNLNNLERGLTSYNRTFGTNFNENDILKHRIISCNTFVIHTKLFDKMMHWLIHYYKDDVNTNRHPFIGNAGEIIEALIGMFLCLEVVGGARYYKFDIQHVWPLYKIIANNKPPQES
jgi:hypothetical protein